MIETWNHQRHQMDCRCQVCSKSWIEKFAGIPKENVIPPEMRKIGWTPPSPTKSTKNG